MKANTHNQTIGPATLLALALSILLRAHAAAGGVSEVAGLTNGARIRWSALPAEQLPGRVFTAEAGDPGDRVQVQNPQGMENRFRLATIQAPQVSGKSYALRIPVRYEGVQGMAYLEMWSFFKGMSATTNEQAFFSRTLAAVGPLAALNGSSAGWTERVLPFFAEGRKPVRVELNLVMPGKGQVELGPAQWIGDADDLGRQLGAMPTPGARWGLYGGVFGVALGLLGAWIGIRRWRTVVETRRMLAADLRT